MWVQLCVCVFLCMHVEGEMCVHVEITCENQRTKSDVVLQETNSPTPFKINSPTSLEFTKLSLSWFDSEPQVTLSSHLLCLD